jgi:glycosyltransferase involved in cell wall biosynthesis
VRIAIAVHHFPPRYQAGAELQAYRTARTLLERGHQARVIAVEAGAEFGRGLEVSDEVFQGVPVRRLAMDVEQSPIGWEFANPLIGEAVGAILRSWDADLLHLIGGYLMSGKTIEAAKQAGLPVVLTVMDFWFLCPRITLMRPGGALCDVPEDALKCVLCLSKAKRRYRIPDRFTAGRFGRAMLRLWRSRAARKLSGVTDLAAAMLARRAYLRRVFGMADVVISHSQFLKDLCERQGMRNNRFVCTRQGLDASRWKQYPRGTGRFGPLRIGFAGQVAPHKGVHVLIEAFDALQGEAELSIYGDLGRFPRYAQRLRRMADGDGRVRFAGQYAPSEVGRVLSALDVLVVPSLWYENSPNSILEAFVAGTPVVASDLGGMAELVRHEVNGLLFETGNALALAACLQRLIDEAELVSRFARQMPRVKTVDEEVDELENIYRSLVEVNPFKPSVERN